MIDNDEKNRGRIVIRRTLTQAAMIARELRIKVADPNPPEKRHQLDLFVGFDDEEHYSPRRISQP